MSASGDGGGRPAERVLTVAAVLLTFASGASDVAGFTRLGGVFTSVMTGNMVVFGLSLARGSVPLAAHTVASFAGYVLGVSAGTRIPWRRALLAELALLAGFTAGWEATGTRPGGAAQFVILVIVAAAMGIQSASVNQMGLGNVSTTYLTGTLTGLVSEITRPGGRARSQNPRSYRALPPGHAFPGGRPPEPPGDGDRARPGRRRPAVLGGLLLGAVLAGTLVAYAAAAVPLLPLLAVGTAAFLTSDSPRWRIRRKSR